jgi:efflux transporter, outer membrane factor lipoprotein, NodT family
VVAVALSLFSCRVGRSFRTPELKEMPATFDEEGMTEGTTADIGWSTLYADTVLQGLISQALDHNKDMLAAAARVRELMAAKRITFAKMFPGAGMDLYGDREYLNYGGDNKKYDPELHANLTFGWEIDIWGNLRWQNEAAVAAYLQSVEAQRALRLTIVSQVAQMYFDLKALDRELSIVRQTLEARRDAVHFATLRYEGGLTSEIPYRQSLVELARTETLLPKLENEIKLKENDLSVLLGEFPAGIPRGGSDLGDVQMGTELPVDLPSSLLERRPDVRQAEQALREANAKVGVALTDMFPKLRLTANLGAENAELTDFLKSPTWFVSGALTGPLFQLGSKRAAHKAAKAAYEQQVYAYEKKILEVFKEVNNALVTYRKSREMRRSADALYRSALSYNKLAKLQYVNGVVSYMDVLDAQRQLFDSEIAVNDAILTEFTATVSLYKALGGGLER